MPAPETQVESCSAKPPLRVAFCITELDPGGAEKALVEIVSQLDRSQTEPRVYCLGPETELSRQLVEMGIETLCFGARRATEIGVLFRLIREFREFRPGVVQTFLFHANILGRIAAWWAKIPRIFSGLRVAERQKRWHMWLDRSTQCFVTMNVCVSEGVRKHAIEAGLRPDKLCVIPNGINASKYADAVPADLRQLGIPRGARTVVTVGRLTRQKGHDWLLHAVAPLFSDPNLHLLIVGEGEERNAILQLARDLKIEERVHLPGWRAEIAEILKACDLFVLPSRWEGMSNALLEAIASGLPCVATDVEGVRDLMGPGDSARIVIPGDVNALRTAVKDALAQITASREKNSQLIDVNKHTWISVAQSYQLLWLGNPILPLETDLVRM